MSQQEKEKPESCREADQGSIGEQFRGEIESLVFPDDLVAGRCLL